MNELNNMLFALLRSAICGEELNRSLFEGLDEETLASLYKIAKKHDMAHAIGFVLEKEGLLPEGKTAEKLAKRQFAAVYRYENQKYELDRISEAFENNGIPYIPLKGSVIRALYPEPWLRSSGDIDILVKRADHERAKEILISSLEYVDSGISTEHDVSLYSQGGVHVELHFTLEGEDAGTGKVLKSAWSFAKPCGGYKHVLSPEFSVFYCAAHALTHFLMGGCGVRTLCDLYLMGRYMEFDEAEVIKLCREAKIEKFYLELSALAEVWFGGKERNELSCALEEFILTGGVFGNATSRIAVKQSTSGSKSAYISKRIFVSYDYLKERYPSLRTRALIPVYQVRRWIDAVRGKRVKRAVAELKISSELTKSETDGIQELLSALEISQRTEKR